MKNGDKQITLDNGEILSFKEVEEAVKKNVANKFQEVKKSNEGGDLKHYKLVTTIQEQRVAESIARLTKKDKPYSQEELGKIYKFIKGLREIAQFEDRDNCSISLLEAHTGSFYINGKEVATTSQVDKYTAVIKRNEAILNLIDDQEWELYTKEGAIFCALKNIVIRGNCIKTVSISLGIANYRFLIKRVQERIFDVVVKNRDM